VRVAALRLIAISLVLWSARADALVVNAPSYTGIGDLITACGINISLCNGYIRGVLDGYNWAHAPNTQPVVFCVPPPTSIDEMRQPIVRQLETQRDHPFHNATALMVDVLRENFPCR
jgi:hypothetical protein